MPSCCARPGVALWLRGCARAPVVGRVQVRCRPERCGRLDGLRRRQGSGVVSTAVSAARGALCAAVPHPSFPAIAVLLCPTSRTGMIEVSRLPERATGDRGSDARRRLRRWPREETCGRRGHRTPPIWPVRASRYLRPLNGRCTSSSTANVSPASTRSGSALRAVALPATCFPAWWETLTDHTPQRLCVVHGDQSVPWSLIR